MTPGRPPRLRLRHTVPSRITMFQHPIHPMLVVYPVAFLSSLLLVDVLYVLLNDAFWARLGLLLNAAGLVAGLLAAAVGTLEFLLLREVRRRVSAWNHFIAGVMLLSLAGLGTMLRWPDPEQAVWPWGLLSSALIFLMVMITGWLGGTLSFKYGVGVYGSDEVDATAERGDDDGPPAG